jgi:hypothetical protein
VQELVGRLTSLDPAASATLKVVGYFDALVGGQVSIEVLARSAAVLAGCAAGAAPAGASRSYRADPAGHRLPPTGPLAWPSHEIGSGGAVWIERVGEAHMNDAMLLERFAIAVAITESRTRSDSGRHLAAEVVVDGAATEADRAAAATRLRLDNHDAVRAVATTVDAPVDPGHASAVLATPFGLARVVIVPADEPWTDSGRRLGLGLPVEPRRLPESWSTALVALRLAEHASPVVDAADLGALLVLAEAADASAVPHPDIAALDAISVDRHALPTLDALVADGSVRAAAIALGIHHSTLQSRLTALADRLGYDPRTPAGRTRYVLARTLHRLRHAAL